MYVSFFFSDFYWRRFRMYMFLYIFCVSFVLFVLFVEIERESGFMLGLIYIGGMGGGEISRELYLVEFGGIRGLRLEVFVGV